MNKHLKIALILICFGFTANCSRVLQTVDLEINTKDNLVQEKFNVVEKTLTIKEALTHKNAPYVRKVLQNGRGEGAKPILEKVALLSEFPENKTPVEYKIGIGDKLSLSKLIENNRSSDYISIKWPKAVETLNYKLGIGDTLTLTLINQIKSSSQLAPSSGNSEDNQNLIITSQAGEEKFNSTGRIGSDGSVLLLEVGRLDANGKSLNELRSEVRNILIRNGVSPRFQLEISEFKSQRSYLTVNGDSKVIILDDQVSTIKDILTSSDVGFKPGVITRVRLQQRTKNISKHFVKSMMKMRLKLMLELATISLLRIRPQS